MLPKNLKVKSKKTNIHQQLNIKEENNLFYDWSSWLISSHELSWSTTYTINL